MKEITAKLQRQMCLASYISEHPIREEKQEYKLKYLAALEFVRNKFAPEDIFAEASMRLYQKQLLDKNTVLKLPDEKSVPKLFRSVMGLRFKWFKFYSYDCVFLMDAISIVGGGDLQKSESIFNDITSLLSNRKTEKLNQFFSALFYNGPVPEKIGDCAQLLSIWNTNRTFYQQRPMTILITATMSSGKSTVVNALVGKKISRTMNEACTAKLHYIINKSCEDGFTSEYDHELVLNADLQTLMEDNKDNQSAVISVGTYFRTADEKSHRVQLIDTPGVGSAWNTAHQVIAEDAIRTVDYDKIVCVLDGNNLGADITWSHLSFLQEHYKKCSIIFLLNKMDVFDSDEDSIKESVSKVIEDLKGTKFVDCPVYPISAKAGYLAKQALCGESLSGSALKDLVSFSRIYEDDFYDCSKYYPELNDKMLEGYIAKMSEEQKRYFNILVKSGLFGFESVLYQ